MKQSLEISWGSLWRIFIFVAFVAILFLGREILLGLFLAIVISSGLEGTVGHMERIGLPRSISVVILFLAAAFVIVILVYAVLPIAIIDLNMALRALGKIDGGTGFFAGGSGVNSVRGFVSQFSSQIFSGGASPLGFLSKAMGGIGLALAVIVSSFYLCLSRDGVERFLKVVTPPDYEAAALRIYERARKKMGAWFHMQLFLSAAMGLLIWGGLTLLHVPYAFLIGILGAFFEIIPFVGPFLAGMVGVVSAFTVSVPLAVYALIFFLIIHQFEAHVMVPLLNRRSVGLHPVIVIIAVLIGAEAGGFLGVVVAIPAAAVFQEVIEDWSMQKRAPAHID